MDRKLMQRMLEAVLHSVRHKREDADELRASLYDDLANYELLPVWE